MATEKAFREWADFTREFGATGIDKSYDIDKRHVEALYRRWRTVMDPVALDTGSADASTPGSGAVLQHATPTSGREDGDGFAARIRAIASEIWTSCVEKRRKSQKLPDAFFMLLYPCLPLLQDSKIASVEELVDMCQAALEWYEARPAQYGFESAHYGLVNASLGGIHMREQHWIEAVTPLLSCTCAPA